jgi:hypothetical protein
MRKSPCVSILTLKPKEICPYKDECYYNKGSETCYGALERDNQFVCNLHELKLMHYKSEKAGLNRGNYKAFIGCSKS